MLPNNNEHLENVENPDDILEIPVLPPDAFEVVPMGDRIFDAKFETPPMGFFKDAMLRFAQNRASVVAFVILAILVLMAIIGPMLTPFTYREQNLRMTNMPPRLPGRLGNIPGFRGHHDITIQARNLGPREHVLIRIVEEFQVPGPGGYVDMLRIRIDGYVYRDFDDVYFWFGSDSIGRCMFTRTWHGLRISLLLGLVVSIFNVIIGVIYGAVQGYYGGVADLIMQRITEILTGVPTVMVMAVAIMFLGASFWTLVIGFTLFGWIVPANATRMQFYRFKNREYVYAASSMGAGDMRIVFRHILPNAAGTLITAFAIMIPNIILSEAFFAFIGLGLQAPTPSLGILNLEGQGALLSNPHLILFPASLISILLICFNVFGNGLRDAFNPSLRGS